MRLFAIAMLARKSEGVFERIEMIPTVVAASSEREAGKEAKREARKTYPKNEGWTILGKAIEISHANVLQGIMTTEEDGVLSLSKEVSERIN
ncbi:MAG TPA: hypothetical protein VFC63_09710 [Blastocatellia bacterium]|nr:hypothetical protein [Blastocatellia bacterium]